jgi:hypothetical protein
MIDFDLEGSAEWRGGLAQGAPDNYILATSLPVECGVNRVLLRSTAQPGKIRLAARSQGLTSATLEFESLPVDDVGGLSTSKPWDGLPSFLEFGPTPSGPTYTVTRKPIEIASTIAGSNHDDVALSLDDNELTNWSNGGGAEDAWITYQFNEPQLIDSVCLKLDRWRTTSYPIRVLADGKSVWNGNTPRSLGYVTLSFEPVQTNSLTIALEGVTSVQDEFGKIVEVTGAVDQSSSRQGRRLSIVEAEIYGPLPDE